MSRTRKQADPPIPRFAELCRLYARHTPDVALGSDDPADAHAALADAAGAHRRLAGRRTPGDAVLDIRDSDDGRALVDLVCDETPLLVQSVLAGVGRVGRRIRRVVHAPVVLRRGSGRRAGRGPAGGGLGRPAVGRAGRGLDAGRARPGPGRGGRGPRDRAARGAGRGPRRGRRRVAHRRQRCTRSRPSSPAAPWRNGRRRPSCSAGWPPAASPSSGTGASGTRDGLGILRHHDGPDERPRPRPRRRPAAGRRHPGRRTQPRAARRTGPSRS